MRKRLSILIAGALVIAVALFVRHARAEAQFTKTISYVHFVTKSLEQRYKDTGEYPESLTVLVTEDNLDFQKVLDYLHQSSEVIYRKPPENADSSFDMLEARQGKRRILVSKEFERRVVR